MTAFGFTFDDAAVVPDDLGDQSQTEPCAGTLGGDKRIEEVGLDAVGNAGAVVLDLDAQRQ